MPPTARALIERFAASAGSGAHVDRASAEPRQPGSAPDLQEALRTALPPPAEIELLPPGGGSTSSVTEDSEAFLRGVEPF